jgi:Uma2 family endonuclease
MPLTRHYSPDDIRALPDDGNRYETVYGELLVTPAPRLSHQLALARLFRVLDAYLTSNGLEQLAWSPAEFTFGPDTLVQPDLFVAELGLLDPSRTWSEVGSLYLVIEVVSPSSAKTDRITKRRLYQQQDIPEYWVVDIDQQQIEVWTPEAHFPVIERERLVWRHPALEATCTVDVRQLLQSG